MLIDTFFYELDYFKMWERNCPPTLVGYLVINTLALPWVDNNILLHSGANYNIEFLIKHLLVKHCVYIPCDYTCGLCGLNAFYYSYMVGHSMDSLPWLATTKPSKLNFSHIIDRLTVSQKFKLFNPYFIFESLSICFNEPLFNNLGPDMLHLLFCVSILHIHQ